VKPETQNWRLELMVLAIPANSCGVTGTGLSLAPQESARQVFGQCGTEETCFFSSNPDC